MDLINDFLSYLSSEKGVSSHTLEAYRRDIKAFFNFYKEHDIEAIDEQKILTFLSYLKERGYASASINRSLIALKVFFRFLKREGQIKTNPISHLPAPKLWQLIPEVLNRDEMETLLQAPDPATEEGARNRAIMELLYSCGLRVSELCHLKLSDVSDEFVRVLGKGNKERVVPIGRKAIEAIDTYLSTFRDRFATDREEALFVNQKGKPLSRISVWRMVKEYAKGVGIVKNISPHTFRHTFATDLLDHGADLRVIQEMLGHESIASTDRYTHISSSHLQEAFRSFHPRP